MRIRSGFIALLVVGATASLAFGPLAPAFQDVRDGKARALQQGELQLPDHHALKEQRAEKALARRASAGDSRVPLPANVPCTAGTAGPYTCQNVDLASIVPLAELGGAAGNDSWGWTDPKTGNEIAIMGTGEGTAFIDVTDPNTPEVLGHVPTESGNASVWRDIKVDDGHAFIVSELSGHGMQVFDLTRLRAHYGSANPTREFAADHVDHSFGSAHNIAVNTGTDVAYIVGGDVCKGGLHMIDISDPLDTSVAGCFDGDGYTHDVQCAVYSGPDPDHNGTTDPQGQADEICFASNTDTVTIVDVTDKDNPTQLARVGYSTAAYTHQGWLTPDQRWFVFNDELDEQNGTVDNTTTYVLDITDLDLGFVPAGDAMGLVTSYRHQTTSTDHNLYVTGDDHKGGSLIWEANYNAGLRILDHSVNADGEPELTEIGYFDIDSAADAPHYGDAWNVYPFFDSGTVVVSNIAQGLFVLRPDYGALTAQD